MTLISVRCLCSTARVVVVEAVEPSSGWLQERSLAVGWELFFGRGGKRSPILGDRGLAGPSLAKEELKHASKEARGSLTETF